MRYVIGDIHGAYSSLRKALDLVNFNPDNDLLYCAGDICDRGTENLKTIRYLMSLDNKFKSTIGNHDIWIIQYLWHCFKEYSLSRDIWDIWMHNGGEVTVDDLCETSDEENHKILEWFENFKYRIELDDFIIQHTPSHKDLIPETEDLTKLNTRDILSKKYCIGDYDSWFWDRDVEYSLKGMYGDKALDLVFDLKKRFNEKNKWMIYGHTIHVDGPCIDKETHLINIDTGSGLEKERYPELEKDGSVCILNIDTGEWHKSNGEKGIFKELTK